MNFLLKPVRPKEVLLSQSSLNSDPTLFFAEIEVSEQTRQDTRDECEETCNFIDVNRKYKKTLKRTKLDGSGFWE